MEENNNTPDNKEETVNCENKTARKNICFENHCWKMCLAMVIAAFLGGFLAVYFVSDQIMERQYKKHFQHKQCINNPFSYNRYDKKKHNNYDEIYEKNLREFERAFEHADRFEMPDMPDFLTNTVNVKPVLDDDEYKVIVDLKPFNYDENKVNYNLSGRKLTIFGKSFVKDKGYEENVSFSQDFILPENADKTQISKEKDGNKLIISVPLK